jgi:polysaccharide pyruvyl transferase WcaK-like protein
MQRYITMFDTSIATDNIGDEIIMDAVMHEARELFPRDFFVRIPTHDTIGQKSRKIARRAHVSLVGGTNLLSANWFLRAQWKIGPSDFGRIGRPVLFGTGWRHYQRPTEFLTSWFLRNTLSSRYQHSVRDTYTLERVRAMGIPNVINTGCPTMWQLTPEHCAKIPVDKSPNAMVTVTAYHHAPEADKAWLELVLGAYQKVYFWPQMFDDLEYVRALVGERLEIVDPNLAAFDHALEHFDVDYIGTRLHGGVRALQRGRRALIIEVDNRAAEVARDTRLVTAKREQLPRIQSWIEGSEPLTIAMPWSEIARWKAQFS